MLSVEMRYENIPMIGGLVTNYESVETMQIGGYANYTTFIYKIAEDVYKKKYLANPVISSKDAGYSWKVFENIKDLYSKDSISPDYYKLTYKTPLYWIKEINILILNKPRKRIRSVSYSIENDVGYKDKAIKNATIVLINPRKSYDIKKALFLEMRHYFIDYNRYINNGYTLTDSEFYDNFSDDYEEIKRTIDYRDKEPFKIKRTDKRYINQIYKNDIAVTVYRLMIVFNYMLYYLNREEMLINRENLFIELEDFKKHHPNETISIDNLCVVDNSPILLQYFKIREILNYILNNTSDEIANLFKMKYSNTLYDICEKLLKKCDSAQKHWLKVLDYTEKYV